MSNIGNPAYTATMGNGAGMMVLAAAGVGLVNALGDAVSAARDAQHQARYDDALSAAISHANQMEALAKATMEVLAEKEMENTRLRAACRQRQEVIDVLKKQVRR